ncbi:hypothetical protein K503DRAFT_863313 [Rhizopogon vinicolor AM-OR11-026]|uniref:Amino acid transporter transmembrane domain-containing protein n=1 Tax=Rhizopogon vinicolor AM-OR11-026 TaxID=1314800 RepID=A0A1B7NBB4_9AGAM|nr:hypothetical protein K503DRAFT_863313 [Rhizopogon vinicolor AM-OR11-026]
MHMVQTSSHSRRSSLDSLENSPISSAASPYSLSGFDSSSALVLLPNQDDQDLSGLSSDEDQEEHDPQLEIMKLQISPLPPYAIFLYLLAPYLRVGAILAADRTIPLRLGLFNLFLAAALSAFSRNIWFLLARYLRKSTAEDIFLEMIPKSIGRAKRKRREMIRRLLLCFTGLLRILIVSMYLRASVDSVYPLVLGVLPLKTGLITTVVFGLLTFVVSLPKSLAAKTVICTTWLSIVSYTAWLVAALYNNATGTPMPSPTWLQRGSLWNDYTSIAFSFATSLTVPLSASLVGRPSVPSNKTGRGKYFLTLNLFSAALATLLILPSMLMTSSPNAPGALSDTPNILVHVLRASSLLFAIPSVLVSTPPLPVPTAVRRVFKFDLSKVTLITVVVLLSLAPPSTAATLNDITLLLALTGTYFLPACAHIVIHYFRRPLSIVMPSHSVPNTPHATQAPSPQTISDVLLQRKERSLQRMRLWRRILWDVGVWLLLIPISLFGMIWAGGRLIGRW